MSTPEQIVDAALARGDRRSPEYRLGMLDVLKYRMHGARIQVPFQLGTSQADAYFAGNDRGHALWRARQEGAPA
ncbi:MAG: hypothetical protein RBS40_00290 [Rhodocyclaceae bacterium]|jgi:hypothetical protein|nr:hypothetical protein [Rhodocyclaceae bacterium]